MGPNLGQPFLLVTSVLLPEPVSAGAVVLAHTGSGVLGTIGVQGHRRLPHRFLPPWEVAFVGLGLEVITFNATFLGHCAEPFGSLEVQTWKHIGQVLLCSSPGR